MSRNQSTTDDEQSSKQTNRYLVLVDNIEIGLLLLGIYNCPTPNEAVRAVTQGDHQSPPSDPAHEIAAEEAQTFTVYEINGHATIVNRDDVQCNEE